MKKSIKVFSCLAASLLMASAASANVELYALDGRTLSVVEEEVALYTAEGMGWYLEKPVTMYALDGRSQVFPADRVEAQKTVGWYLKEELPGNTAEPQTPDSGETQVPSTDVNNTHISIKYTDGTIVSVPKEHLDTYKTLGWKEAAEADLNRTVVMYDANGNTLEVPYNEVGRYELEGWSTVKPSGNKMTVYSYDGTEKQINDSQYASYKAQGWYASYDEAVYNYAMYGNGSDVTGAKALLADKRYELSYNMVRDALDRIETSGSEYVTKLYDMRSEIMETWGAAAKSPLGFINYWFAEKDGKDMIVFEYRNVSNNRIKSFRINFDICDADGNIIEKNSGSYYIENLQMAPCDKKKVAWLIETGDEAKSIKNLKVKEVTYADGTKWTAAN